MRVRLVARLGNVRIPLQIDVGLGDAIVPAPEELEFPTLLKAPAPNLKAYPKGSVVAEKFEAIVKFGMANKSHERFLRSLGACPEVRIRECGACSGHPSNVCHAEDFTANFFAVSIAEGTSMNCRANKRNGRRSWEKAALKRTLRWRKPSG